VSELRIYKYPLEFRGSSYTVVEMPAGAVVLKLAMQDGKETLWAIVDPEADTVEYSVMYSGTGWRLTAEIDKWKYIETLFSNDGSVWHYFWRLRG
jgi:hypothetical protein